MLAEDVMDRYIGHARAGDWDAAFGCFAQDIAFRVPGRSGLSGEFRGRDAARRYIETARALSHDADVELEVIDTLTSRDRVCLLVREVFRRDGEVVEIRRANVYRVAGGEIVEIWIYEGDQYAVDALFAEAA